MDDKATLQELNVFEQELIQKFNDKVNSTVILENLSAQVVKLAQLAVNTANTTESYDEKIQSLVKGIQEIVAIVNNVKDDIDIASQKHISDLSLLTQIKSRFSEYEKMEKKNKIDEIDKD